MNYNYLIYFSVLAQTEHYTTAAARLGISQPALSSAIHQLENSLGGVSLFEKVGRNIRLTDEGRFYQETVNEALKKLQGAAEVLRDSKTLAPVVIRMGVVSGTLDGLLADNIAKYMQSNPRIRFQLTESSAESLMDMVRHEHLDMAIVDSSDRDRSLHFRKLYERGFYVAMPNDHPMADREEIDPADILSEPQVVFNYDLRKSFQDWTAGKPSEENIVCNVNTAQSALDLVKGGVGIACIPGQCREQRSGITYVPLKNWHQALYMCILYDKWLEPPIWDFIELMVKAFRSKGETI